MIVYQVCLCFEDGGLTTNYFTAKDDATARRHFGFWASRNQTRFVNLPGELECVELWSYRIGEFNVTTGRIDTERVAKLAEIELDQWTLSRLTVEDQAN